MEACWLVLPDSELSKDGKLRERTEKEIDAEFTAADRGKMEAWNRKMLAREAKGRLEGFRWRTRHSEKFANVWPTTEQDRIDIATWKNNSTIWPVKEQEQPPPPKEPLANAELEHLCGKCAACTRCNQILRTRTAHQGQPKQAEERRTPEPSDSQTDSSQSWPGTVKQEQAPPTAAEEEPPQKPVPAPSTPSRWGVKRPKSENVGGPGPAYLNMDLQGEAPTTPQRKHSDEEGTKEPGPAKAEDKTLGEKEQVPEMKLEEQ